MKRSEMKWAVEPSDLKRPEARPGMVWVERSSEGRRYIGQGIGSLTEACKTLGEGKVIALANRALGIEEKAEVQPLLKSGKYAEAQTVVLNWKPEAVATRQPRKAPEVKLASKKTYSAEEVAAALAAAGIKLVTDK